MGQARGVCCYALSCKIFVKPPRNRREGNVKRAILTYRYQKKIAPYADALRSAGVEPVLTTPDTAPASLGHFGLVLTGGTDLDPSLYGAEPHASTQSPDRERDALELRLLREALDRDLPVLAICRGMQLFNVAHPGGTLVQDVSGHRAPHAIAVEAGTRLAQILGVGTRNVNSRHHQAVGLPARELIVSARAPDGVIEALERADRRFSIAVQWHPEDIFVQERALFEAFGEAL